MKYKKDHKGKATVWPSYLNVPSSGESSSGAIDITAATSHSLQYASQPIINSIQSSYEDTTYRDWLLLTKSAVPRKDTALDLSNAQQPDFCLHLQDESYILAPHGLSYM